MSALTRQEGGDHYRVMPIQPAAFSHANGLGHLEGDIVAYVSRWRRKGGISDLRKAIHSLELLIELEERGAATARPVVDADAYAPREPGDRLVPRET